MTTANGRLLFFGYTFLIIGLFFYSFTQIDLGLALNRSPLLFSIQRAFQWVGYFNRPFSTAIYAILLLFLFGFYIAFLYHAVRKKITVLQVWKVLLFAVPLLMFTYNAFSYDLFNYIFDAKIVTYYHQNPYIHKALDYPGDPMLGFMHWTHRVYPYGPLWLGLTIPLSFFGFNIFLPTFFLFKLFIGASFLGTVYYIGRIMQKIAPEREVASMVFFALNPLVLIESLVSAHNDIVMLFFAVFALYILLNMRYASAVLYLLASIAIKFVTILLAPVYAYIAFLQIRKREVPWERLFFFMTVLMSLATLLAIYRTNFQPWYLLYPLAFASFVARHYYIRIPAIILSLGALLTYIPYLFLGNWDPPVPELLLQIQIATVFLAILTVGVYAFFHKRARTA